MKKLIVSLLAVAGMVACSNEDVVRQQAGEAIGFSGAFVENVTRANDPSITTGSIDAFRVWAFMDEVSGEVLKNELVTKGEDGLWSYTNVQYWMPGHTYYFAALAPEVGNWTLDTEYANKYGAGVVEFDNAAAKGAEDLLYAATSVESKLSDNAPVKFLFNHLLSKIKFTFVSGFATDNITIDVTDVTMTAPASGSINLAVENWWDNNEDWVNLPENNDLTLAFGDVATLKAGASAEADDERLTIPASAEREYVVNFKVVVKSGAVVAYEGTKTVKVENIAFEIGKAYNLKAVLDASNITEDGTELEPIVFDVEEVKDWDYGVENENEHVIYAPESGDDESQEPEIVIPGEGVTYDMDYRYTTLVAGLDANNSLRVKQENDWIWDIKFNTGLASIEPGDYKAGNSYFSSNDALEVDTYNGGFQNNTYNYIYPDEFDKVTTFNVQKKGDIYYITMIGSGGYGNDVGTFRCVYIGKIK